jgi:hypothetical protein
MDRAHLVLLVVALSGCPTLGFQAQYRLRAFNDNVTVAGPTVVLEADILLTEHAQLFVNSDGSCIANSQNAIGDLYIQIDGTPLQGKPVSLIASNFAVVSWDGAAIQPQQHSFNVLGAPELDAGTYQVKLMAKPEKGAFTVAGLSNLSVMQPHAAVFKEVVLNSDSPPPPDIATYNFSTYNLPHWLNCEYPDPRPANNNNPIQPGCVPQPDQPLSSPAISLPEPDHLPIVSYTASSDGQTPWIVLASGRSYHAGNSTNTSPNMDVGDAMWGLYVDGHACDNSNATWSINDFSNAAELQAPMSNQGFFSTLSCGGGAHAAGTHVISLDATKMPVYDYNQPNAVKYKVGAGTRMVVLSGGMQLAGSGRLGHDLNNPTAYIPVGGLGEKSTSFTGACAMISKPIDCDVPIMTSPIDVPPGHDGVVFFAARARNLGNQGSEHGSYRLWIEVKPVGAAADPNCKSSLGIQGGSGSASQRTLSASYLAAGDCKLKPGASYTATVYGHVEGDFNAAALSAEVPLIWFDDAGPR